ncbi:MAG: leucine-rich repeat protein, partial [Spirochaetales bacterium]|nr:leucine-rich repeat protein [Spirochaetales bacterium]
MGNSTFVQNQKLKKLVIPGTVKEIDEWAFSGCKVLEELVIEEGVEVIGFSAFYDCLKL